MKKIEVDLAGCEVGFEEALELAAAEAAYATGQETGGMAVFAWYERRSHRSSPEVGFASGSVVNWEKNAVHRGADVWVEFGEESFIVLCGSSHKH